jgi:hypothetical protein
MKYIFSLVIFLVLGQILSWGNYWGGPWGGCGFRGCRRWGGFYPWGGNGCFGSGCGGYGFPGNNFYNRNSNAIANTNSIALNTGDFGVANSNAPATAITA